MLHYKHTALHVQQLLSSHMIYPPLPPPLPLLITQGHTLNAALLLSQTAPPTPLLHSRMILYPFALLYDMVIHPQPSVRHTDEPQSGRKSCLWLFHLCWMTGAVSQLVAISIGHRAPIPTVLVMLVGLV